MTGSAKNRIVSVDMNELMPWDRHAAVLDAFDNLKPGEMLEVKYNHDPRPLHYRFMIERRGRFCWQASEKEPGKWLTTLTKL